MRLSSNIRSYPDEEPEGEAEMLLKGHCMPYSTMFRWENANPMIGASIPCSGLSRADELGKVPNKCDDSRVLMQCVAGKEHS